MILSARRRHKIIWVVLGVLLPLLVVAGVYFRHIDPVNSSIPAVERNAAPPERN